MRSYLYKSWLVCFSNEYGCVQLFFAISDFQEYLKSRERNVPLTVIACLHKQESTWYLVHYVVDRTLTTNNYNTFTHKQTIKNRHTRAHTHTHTHVNTVRKHTHEHPHKPRTRSTHPRYHTHTLTSTQAQRDLASSQATCGTMQCHGGIIIRTNHSGEMICIHSLTGCDTGFVSPGAAS